MKDLDTDGKSKSSNSRLVPKMMTSRDEISERDASGQRTTVWTIENSIEDLCKLKFLFIVGGTSFCEFFETWFKIDQEKISFIFRFQESDLKYTTCEFCLNLPQELWILKEKLMLNTNPELIKTYNPVIYNILLKCFFSIFFSQSAKGLSVQPFDVERVENLKRQMGLMYPVEMTRLARYDLDYFYEINMFHQEFTKLDLDNLQALLKVLCYFSRLVRALRSKSPLGSCHVRRLDMDRLADANSRPVVGLLNSLFVLDFKASLLRQALDDRLFLAFACDRPLGDKEDVVTVHAVLTLLERFATRADSACLLAAFGKEGDKNRPPDEFKSHLKRNVVVDEYGVVNFLDLGFSITRSLLKADISQFANLLTTLNSELKGYLVLNENQKLLLLFFLVLEHCLTFTVEIDSAFKQKWERGYSKKSPLITTDGEKRGAIKKAILEIAVPKLDPQLTDGLSLSDLYYIGHSSQNSAKTASKLNPTIHPIFEDLNHRPYSVFQFLMDICLKIENCKAINRLNEFLLDTVQEEKEASLEKTRCFYMIRKRDKSAEVKILYSYRFKYSHIKRGTGRLEQDLRGNLKKLATDAHQDTGVYKQAFNNFFRFYGLTVRSLPPPRALASAPPPVAPSSRDVGPAVNKLGPELGYTGDPRESMFGANFAEAMQHVAKSTNVR
jgi:hypothetical protein